MSPAIAAAFKVCLALRSLAPNVDMAHVTFTYPAGFQRCPDIEQAYLDQRAADDAASMDVEMQQNRATYDKAINQLLK